MLRKVLAILLLAPPWACPFAEGATIDVIPHPAQIEQLADSRVRSDSPTTQQIEDESLGDEGSPGWIGTTFSAPSRISRI